jgi:hypothetical protein
VVRMNPVHFAEQQGFATGAPYQRARSAWLEPRQMNAAHSSSNTRTRGARGFAPTSRLASVRRTWNGGCFSDSEHPQWFRSNSHGSHLASRATRAHYSANPNPR